MKTIFTIIITLIVLGIPSKDRISVNDFQNCSAELTVEKDRSFKSATENGAEFTLTLTNTSETSASYSLTTSKSLASCSNKANDNTMDKSTVKNSDLNVSFSNNNSEFSKRENFVITLDKGQSKEFKINAIAPVGTPYNTWGCIEVKANAINCKSVSAELILSVYIPDPSEG